MATSVGTLAASLSLNLDGYTRGLAKAEAEQRKSIARMERESNVRMPQMRKDILREIGASGRALRNESLQYQRGTMTSLDMGGGLGQEMRAVGQMREMATESRKAVVSWEGMAKAGVIVGAGIKAASIATAVIRADWEGAAEAARRFPIAGGLAEAGAGMIADKLGWTAETDKWNEVAATNERDNRVAAQREAAFRQSLSAFQESSKAATRERLDLRAGTGPGADLIQSFNREADEVDAINERLAEAIKKQNSLGADKENISRLRGAAGGAIAAVRNREEEARLQMGVRAAEELAQREKAADEAVAQMQENAALERLRAEGKQFEAERRQVDRHYEELVKQHGEGRRQIFEAMKQGDLEDIGRRERQARQREAEEILDIDAQITAARLREKGKDTDAELMLTARQYESQIWKAREEGNTTKAIALQQLGGMELASIARADQADTGSAGVITSSRLKGLDFFKSSGANDDRQIQLRIANAVELLAAAAGIGQFEMGNN